MLVKFMQKSSISKAEQLFYLKEKKNTDKLFMNYLGKYDSASWI